MSATPESDMPSTKYPNYDDLSDRIKQLSHNTEVYKSQVNVVGGIFIGIIVILVIAVVWILFLLINMKRKYQEENTDLMRRFTIARPHLKHTNSVSGGAISKEEPMPNKQSDLTPNKAVTKN